MSTECDRAARWSLGPMLSAGTPFAVRTAFIARRIAYSPALGPMAVVVVGGVESAAAAVPGTAGESTSSSATTLRMRLFSDIRESGAAVYCLRQIIASLRSREALSFAGYRAVWA